jgi:hypothetical protein
MMKNRIILVITFFLYLVFLIACGGQDLEQDDDLENGRITPGGHTDAKSITAFSFQVSDNSDLSSDVDVVGSIDETAKTIKLTVPYYRPSVPALKPTIVITGVSVSPKSGTAIDFAKNVTYTVTAADDLTQDYVVTVKSVALFGSAIFGTDIF